MEILERIQTQQSSDEEDSSEADFDEKKFLLYTYKHQKPLNY